MMKINLDKIGMSTSSICAVHCILLPLLVTLLPFISFGFLNSEAFENVIFWASMLCGIGSICFGNIYKKNKFIFFILSTGLLLLLLANFAHERNWNPYSSLIMISAGIFMCTGHWFSNKLCNSCKSCKLSKNNE